MYEQQDKMQLTQKDEANRLQRSDSKKLTALAFDRDKNFFYLASDESIDEVLDQDGYHVVHANRNLPPEN